ncbi:MAG: radical SAM protein [Candidatus Methanoplasma sp.]|jgi:uncharacterized protein|nr:radical SAM protein [Candidatus Methanoplasma sp.]
MKPYLSVIIKPTLACNIDCRHCYHTEEERAGDPISIERLDKLFKAVSEEYESAWFIWHGGEPLMLSLQFYRDAIALEEKYFGKDSHRVGNTIQTNGTRLDRKFADFCRDNKINVGVSYEGEFNDVLRERTADVEKNLELLRKKEYVFSVSSTISSGTVSKQTEIYKTFRDRKMAVSFSPVIPAGCAAVHSDLVPNAEEYVSSSIETFDLWLKDKDSEIPLIPHYLYVLNALGEPVESDCAHTSCLTKWLCIYPNGDLYPCAKGCPSEFRLGNIDAVSQISDAFASEGFKKILIGTIQRREKCKQCSIFEYCNGGCSIDAYYESGIDNKEGDSCRIYREIFTHVLETVNGILEDKPDLSGYNKFVRDAVLGKLINPKISGV